MTMQPDELRTLRDTVGMTQGQLAAELGMNRVTISDMENGRAPIERRTAQAARHIIQAVRLERLARSGVRQIDIDEDGSLEPGIDITEQINADRLHRAKASRKRAAEIREQPAAE